MDGSKEMFVRMREEDFSLIPHEYRQRFLSERVIVPGQHKELYDTDERYRKLYKLYKDAKKALEKYKFDKRHADNRSNIK
jgi:hypothetical protein